MASLVLLALGLVVTTLGAVIIAIPLLAKKATLEEMAATIYKQNPHLLAALLRQRKYAVLGVALVIVGTGLQNLGTFWP